VRRAVNQTSISMRDRKLDQPTHMWQRQCVSRPMAAQDLGERDPPGDVHAPRPPQRPFASLPFPAQRFAKRAHGLQSWQGNRPSEPKSRSPVIQE